MEGILGETRAGVSVGEEKLEHDLTKEMLANGAWKTAAFKEYTLVPGAGNIPGSGHVHPLLKVRRAFQRDFLTAGFSRNAHQ